MKKGPNFLTNKTLLFVEVLVKTQLLANRYIYINEKYKSLCGLCCLTISFLSKYEFYSLELINFNLPHRNRVKKSFSLSLYLYNQKQCEIHILIL